MISTGICPVGQGFLFARKIHPTTDNTRVYQQVVDAALEVDANLGFAITPKLHLMLKHIRWQMENLGEGVQAIKWRLRRRSSIKWVSRNEHAFVQ
jgi:hypothetical protein